MKPINYKICTFYNYIEMSIMFVVGTEYIGTCTYVQ